MKASSIVLLAFLSLSACSSGSSSTSSGSSGDSAVSKLNGTVTGADINATVVNATVEMIANSPSTPGVSAAIIMVGNYTTGTDTALKFTSPAAVQTGSLSGTFYFGGVPSPGTYTAQDATAGAAFDFSMLLTTTGGGVASYAAGKNTKGGTLSLKIDSMKPISAPTSSGTIYSVHGSITASAVGQIATPGQSTAQTDTATVTLTF